MLLPNGEFDHLPRCVVTDGFAKLELKALQKFTKIFFTLWPSPSSLAGASCPSFRNSQSTLPSWKRDTRPVYRHSECTSFLLALAKVPAALSEMLQPRLTLNAEIPHAAKVPEKPLGGKAFASCLPFSRCPFRCLENPKAFEITLRKPFLPVV